MKTGYLKLAYLFLVSLVCIHVNAQSRIKKKYFSADEIQNHSELKKGGQTFLPSSLSGYYFEGFENSFPPAGWQTVDVLDTTYVWTSSDYADFPRAYEGLKSAYCHYTLAANTDGEDWLISPQFTVGATDSLFFQFKLEYFGYAPDSTFILISTTDSALSSFTTVLDYFAEGLNYPADSSNWYLKNYSLSAYAGQNIYVAFKYKNTFGDGIFIDNVELGTRPAAEASVLSIDMDNYYPAGTSNPKATVKNNGGTTQTFDVTMNISGGYTSTKTVTVSPQSNSQINFDPWNAAVGNYTVNVQTFLAGDSNPANDTLSSSLNVLEPFVNYGWSTHDPLVIPTFGSAVTSVNNGSTSRLFAIGGYGNQTIIPDAFEYDLAFSTFSGIAPLFTECTYAASATGNGKIFVFGGRTLSVPQGATQIYDYANDSWSYGNPMPVPVVTAAFATYKDSLVYIIDGLIDATGVANNAIQIYNMYTDTWSTGTSLPGAAKYSLRAGIVKNKIVVAGGYDPVVADATGDTYVGEIDTLNPTQITWTQVADYPTGKISRQGACVSVDKNSSLVVFTGGSPEASINTKTNLTFAFDVNSNSWKLGPQKPTERNLFYMTPIVYNDSVYLVAMGGNPPGNVLFDSDVHEWLNLGYYQTPTGIAENNFIADANLFPNPVNDVITLTMNLKNATRIKIKITDVIGNVVMTVCDKNFVAGKNNISIQTKNLDAGMYFCVIDANGNSVTKKLIKN